MATPISVSLQQFTDQMNMAEALMKIERDGYGNPPSKTEMTAVMGLRGGAVVLMVAAFERFLRDCVEEHLAALVAAKVPSAKLPPKMQTSNVFVTLELAMRGLPYGPKLDRINRLPEVDTACRHVISGLVNPEAFSLTGSNPNAGTLKEMLSQIGVEDAFNRLKPDFEKKWGKAEAQTFVRDKLDEIVNLRHKVAHTANALDVTRGQLREAVKFLRILAFLFDREVHSQVKQILAKHTKP